MSDTELAWRRTWRLIGAALLLALACSLATLSALRAQAQMPGPQAGEIPDDPVVAPDPHQSADNNVSFPTDI
jgi:hypothetical protein